MSNTHKKLILQRLHGLALLLGVAFLTMGGLGASQARVTSGGSTVIDLSPHTLFLHGAAPSLNAGISVNAGAGTQLVLGILLLALGFLFHAWLTVLKRDGGNDEGERSVSVHTAIKKPRIRRIPEPQWFWMEIDVEKA